MSVAEYLKQSPRRALLAAGAVGMGIVLVVVSATSNAGESTGTPVGSPPPATTPVVTPTVTPTVTPAGPTASPRPTRPATTQPPATATPNEHGEHRPAPTGPIRATAGQYLAAFLDRKTPTAQRAARLRALSTTSHAATLATVPRTSVPHATTAALAVIRIGSSTATVRANLTDGEVLLVALVLDTDGWNVARVVPQAPVVRQ